MILINLYDVSFCGIEDLNKNRFLRNNGTTAFLIFNYNNDFLNVEYDLYNGQILIDGNKYSDELYKKIKKILYNDTIQNKVLNEYSKFGERLHLLLKDAEKDKYSDVDKQSIRVALAKYKAITDKEYVETKKQKLKKFKIFNANIGRYFDGFDLVKVMVESNFSVFTFNFVVEEGKIATFDPFIISHHNSKCSLCSKEGFYGTCIWFYGIEKEFLDFVMHDGTVKQRAKKIVPEFYSK